MIEKHKVLAYITRGQQLLVFTHSLSPEAGIQVPAGTVEEGETPQKAVLREAQEETGISDFKLGGCLGDYKEDMRKFGKDEIHHRFVYHLICTEAAPETWRHGEFNPSESDETYIPFDFHWVDLPDDVPELAGGQGKFIPELLKIMRLNT